LATKMTVVYDIETTGLSPADSEITQLSAEKTYRDENGNVIVAEKFNRFIKIRGRVPREITALTGITNEMLARDGVPVKQAMQEFEAFVGDAILVAHNGKRFDSLFLAREMSLAGVSYSHTELDTLLLAKKLWPGRKSYKLGTLIDDFGLEKTEAHRADNDVEMLVGLLYYARSYMTHYVPSNLREVYLNDSMFNTNR
jgi:DNA polymerase-3 subunit alpha (Gram-positive type)